MTLDDNTRSGLQFLTLGAAVVLVLVVLDRAVEGGSATRDPGAYVLRPFQHGYLLGDFTVVDADTARGERLAWAVVMGGIVAAIGGVFTHLVARKRWVTLAVVRLLMLVAGGWCAHAALYRPAHLFFLRDRMVVEWRYIELVADIPLPFTRSIQLFGGPVEAVMEKGNGSGCGRVHLMLNDHDTVHLSSIPLPLDDCEAAAGSTLRTGKEAAAMLNGYLHR